MEFAENHYRKDWTTSEMVAIKRAIEPYQKQAVILILLEGS